MGRITDRVGQARIIVGRAPNEVTPDEEVSRIPPAVTVAMGTTRSVAVIVRVISVRVDIAVMSSVAMATMRIRHAIPTTAALARGVAVDDRVSVAVAMMAIHGISIMTVDRSTVTATIMTIRKVRTAPNSIAPSIMTIDVPADDPDRSIAPSIAMTGVVRTIGVVAISAVTIVVTSGSMTTSTSRMKVASAGRSTVMSATMLAAADTVAVMTGALTGIARIDVMIIEVGIAMGVGVRMSVAGVISVVMIVAMTGRTTGVSMAAISGMTTGAVTSIPTNVIDIAVRSARNT